MSDPIYGNVPRDLTATNIYLGKTLTGCANALVKAQTVTACVGEFKTLIVNNNVVTGDVNLLPSGDSLIVTPDLVQTQIRVNGESGIQCYGLTVPSNTLTLRDLRNLSPFVIGTNPATSEYQLISAAVNAASTLANPQNILIQDGVYFADNISITANAPVLTGVGFGTNLLQTCIITIDGTALGGNTVYFTNLSLDTCTVTVINGAVVVFENCRLENCTTIVTNSTLDLRKTVLQNGALTVTGGIMFIANSSLLLAAVCTTVTFSDNIDSSSFSNLTVINSPARFVFSNCQFIGTLSFTLAVVPITQIPVIKDSLFENVTTTIQGSSVLSIIGCTSDTQTLTVIAPAFYNSEHSSFINATFGTFTSTSVKFKYCSIGLLAPMVFATQLLEGAELVGCNVFSMSNSGPLTSLIQVNGSGAGASLTTHHCSFNGFSAVDSSTSPIFNLINANDILVLYSAFMSCVGVAYAGGTGTIVRPVTSDGVNPVQGTNILNGLPAAGTIVLTNAYPWTGLGFIPV